MPSDFTSYANYHSTINNMRVRKTLNLWKLGLNDLKTKKIENNITLICKKRQFILTDMQIITLLPIIF